MNGIRSICGCNKLKTHTHTYSMHIIHSYYVVRTWFRAFHNYNSRFVSLPLSFPSLFPSLPFRCEPKMKKICYGISGVQIWSRPNTNTNKNLWNEYEYSVWWILKWSVMIIICISVSCWIFVTPYQSHMVQWHASWCVHSILMVCNHFAYVSFNVLSFVHTHTRTFESFYRVC